MAMQNPGFWSIPNTFGLNAEFRQKHGFAKSSEKLLRHLQLIPFIKVTKKFFETPCNDD